MQMSDLVKPIDQLSDDELLERIRAMRHRREVLRPAKKAHIERAAKKVTKVKDKKTNALLAAMSSADRAALIAILSNTTE